MPGYCATCESHHTPEEGHALTVAGLRARLSESLAGSIDVRDRYIERVAMAERELANWKLLLEVAERQVVLAERAGNDFEAVYA